jgi:diguanylate cyclase (GGDEF)-like protein/PAS domain S-box-containing protein
MLATIAPAAYVYVIILTIGSITALWMTEQRALYLLSLLLVVYVITLFYCIHWLQRLFNSQLLARASVQEKSQLIGLLLKEFEQSSSDWLWQCDVNGLIQNPSPRFAEAVQRDVRILDSSSLFMLLDEGAERNALHKHFIEQHSFRDHIVRFSVEGKVRWLALTGQPLYEQGQFIGYRGVASDITVVKEAEDHIAFLAHFDHLTGLPNRFSFRQRIEATLKMPPEIRGTAALMYLDLDNFKLINDTLGHPAGDQILLELSKRLQSLLPATATLARLGGDEFAIIADHCRSRAEIEGLAKAILAYVQPPFHIDGNTLYSTVTIGVRLLKSDDHDPDILLKHADLALYKAKAEGRNQICFFEEAMDSQAQERRQLETDLQQAVARGELVLLLQPMWDTQTGAMVACEALVRWQHPKRGLLAPDSWLAAAEQCGLIGAIGEWVLRSALEATKQLPPEVNLSVNLSPIQLRNIQLTSMVINALATSGVAPDRLELEITESALLEETETNLLLLRQLAAIGVRIALDDFGTGYSSLSYLRMFPFHKIKIDKSFIRHIVERDDCRAIVRSICSMAAALGMQTTAEGVETEEQFALVKAVGCDQVQGYVFAAAMPVEEIVALLAEPHSKALDLLAKLENARTANTTSIPVKNLLSGRWL